MAKQSGLGYRFFIDGFDISGDTAAINKVSMASAVQDVTDITLSAHARQYTLRDGEISVNCFFNPSAARSHIALKNNFASGPTDAIAMLFCGTTVGTPVAALQGRQVNYTQARSQNGDLLMTADVKGDGFGTEWCEALTPGAITDASPANGAGFDGQLAGLVGVSSSFGLSAYLEVFSLAGTSITVKLQDSADNVTFADIAGAAFTAVATPGPGQQRIETSLTATVRRYVRAISTGTFTNGVYACAFSRYLAARDP